MGTPTRRDNDQDNFVVVVVEQVFLLLGRCRRGGEGEERARAEGKGPTEVGAGTEQLGTI